MYCVVCRCLHAQRKYGNPVNCEHCKLKCAFHKSTEAKKKVNTILRLCVWINITVNRLMERHCVYYVHWITKRHYSKELMILDTKTNSKLYFTILVLLLIYYVVCLFLKKLNWMSLHSHLLLHLLPHLLFLFIIQYHLLLGYNYPFHLEV